MLQEHELLCRDECFGIKWEWDRVHSRSTLSQIFSFKVRPDIYIHIYTSQYSIVQYTSLQCTMVQHHSTAKVS